LTTHAASFGELQARRAFPDRLGPKGKPLTSTDHKLIGYDVLPFVWNVFKSWRYGEPVMVDDPWGFGNSLEWTTSCPPPRHNFTELPRIRSQRPAFEMHFPHMVARLRDESHVRRGHREMHQDHAVAVGTASEKRAP